MPLPRCDITCYIMLHSSPYYNPDHNLISKGTEGLVRGQQVTDTGAPITIPVGDETLGRIINVIGDPIDERGPVVTDK